MSILRNGRLAVSNLGVKGHNMFPNKRFIGLQTYLSQDDIGGVDGGGGGGGSLMSRVD